MDTAIQERIQEWLSDDYDADTRAEIQKLIDEGNEKELIDRFYTHLDFGTGGLRGIIGAGTNRINKYNIGKVTQGLAAYILKQGPDAVKKGVAIAYDSRYKSDRFALEAALVLAGNGIKVYVSKELRPTPFLSFAVRHYGTMAGIVITASHNPKEYNGYKVYWEDGAQVVPPHDKNIISEVKQITSVKQVKKVTEKDALNNGLLTYMDADIDEAYIAMATKLSINPDLIKSVADDLSIVYSPIHGSGITLLPKLLERIGFKHVHIVEEQKNPDPAFSTVQYPNPEEAEAMKLAVQTGKKVDADVIFATDPDADRIGMAVKNHQGDYELLNGNQTGSLLVYYVLSQLKEKGSLPENGAVIKTIVTTDLQRIIAEHFGVDCVEVLTGFKYIGERIREYERQGSPEKPIKRFLVGGEESYGYLVGTSVRDKDAVSSGAMIAEIAAYAKSQNKSVYDILTDIYKQFGYYKEHLKSITLKGKEGMELIMKIMAELRDNPPKAFADTKVQYISDYKRGITVEPSRGQVVGTLDLPPSNVLSFYLHDETKITIRPSGTEPKIKIYISAHADTKGRELSTVEKMVTERIDQYLSEFLAIVDRIVG